MADGIKKTASIDLDQAALGVQQFLTGGLVTADKAVSSMNRDPLSKGIDMATKSLGLPPLAGEFAKFAIGGARLATGDATAGMMFADGFLGCQAELWSMAPPVTELVAGDLNIGIDERGRVGYDLRIKGNPNDPVGRMIDIESSTWAKDPTGIVDFFAGGQAAKYLDYFHDALYHGGKYPSVFNPGGNPSVEDYGGGQKPDPATGKPPPSNAETVKPNPAQPTPIQPEPGIDLAGKDLEYYNALKTLERNFDLIDSGSSSVTGKSSRDGFISYQDLDAMSRSTNPDIAKAAKFLLTHPEYFGKLNGAGAKDGKIEINEIRAEIYTLESEAKKPAPANPQPAPANPPPNAGTTPPPATGTPPPNSSHPPVTTNPVQPKPIQETPANDLGAQLSAIINDPNLSVEQKIMLLLEAVMKSADTEMLGIAEEIASENARRAKLIDDGASKSDIAASEQALNDKAARLQRLMEKRKSMYELLTTYSSKNHEQAMSAIQNMGRI